MNFYELLPKHPIKPEIKALIEREGPVSLEEYRALRMNSYDREALIPKLSEAIIGQYMPEMLKRFRRRGLDEADLDD